MANSSVFAQDEASGLTTLSELERVAGIVEPESMFGCYAYATQSGAYAFNLKFQSHFWASTGTRWLFGIDYGRTHPSALRYIVDKPNTEVRIHDGAWLVERDGFIPRRDFHPKAAIFANHSASRFGLVIGSGNFSSNGLHSSVEAGCSLTFDSADAFQSEAGQFVAAAEALWASATPVGQILEIYEERWTDVFSWAAKASEVDEDVGSYFWIEAGYVTQNRGPDKPGNQIDFPKGMNRYFGFNAPEDIAKNSVIGPVTIATEVGDGTTNNLRFGNNSMEKMSLPIPETHGFDVYDGKVLVFERKGAAFVLRVLESADFDAAFGSRLANVQTMGSGRQYGIILD